MVVPAGRRSGKTEIAKRKVVRELPKRKPWPNPRYFYCAPTHGQARAIAWDDIKALIPKEWVREIHESGRTIVTNFGSSIHVFGLDKPQRMEGSPWDGGVLDESCDLKEGAFEKSVYPALSDRRGWCWQIGVPKRQGPSAPSYKERFESALRGDHSDWAAFTWPSSDILPPDIIERAKATLDDKTYREQYEASFETAGGLIYSSFSYEFNVRPSFYRPDMPIIVGSDFNVTPMAWVLCHDYPGRYHGDIGRLEVFDEIFLRDTTTPWTLDHLFNRYGKHEGGFMFYGDATSQSRHTNASITDYQTILTDERFRRLGRTVHYPKSNPGRAARYDSVNALLCNARKERRLFVDPNCKKLIRDLQYVTYDPGTREGAKVGELTHISDALGYVVWKRYPIALSEPFDTSDEMFNVEIVA